MIWHLTYTIDKVDRVPLTVSIEIPCKTFKEVRRWWRKNQYKTYKLRSGRKKS